MFRHLTLTFALLAALTLPVFAQQPDSQDKPSTFTARLAICTLARMPTPKQGLPLYPGAAQTDEKDNDPLNFGILTEASE